MLKIALSGIIIISMLFILCSLKVAKICDDEDIK